VIALLVDENFNGDILDGLKRREPDLDMVDVRHVGLAATSDPAILEGAGFRAHRETISPCRTAWLLKTRVPSLLQNPLRASSGCAVR
jgi:hypothetical protein